MTSQEELPLLNTFDLETEHGTHRVIAFIDPVLAGARGISTRRIVGGFPAGSTGDFDPSQFAVNPEFVAALTDYMNSEPSRSPEILEQARDVPGQWLYILDPRNDSPEDEEPPAGDILGCYAVDDAGQIVPSSFQYNA